MKYFVILFFVTNLWANEYIEKEHLYFFGDKIYSFVKHHSKGYLVLKHCSENGVKCRALSILKNPPKLFLKESSSKGGRNPGSIVCKMLPDSTVVIARDTLGNQQSFCSFKDGSMISTGILATLY